MLKQANLTPKSSNLLPFLPALRSSAPGLPSEQASRCEGGPARRPRLLRTDARPGAALEHVPDTVPTAWFAHDARNALTSISLLAGLLSEPGVLKAADAHLAADLAHAARALGGIVEQWAALDVHCAAGVRTFEPEPQPARQLSVPTLPQSGAARATAGAAIESCAGLLRVAAGPAVSVFVSCESGLPPLAIGDHTLLRVLTNLVKNAGESMAHGGTVRVTARRALSRTAPAVLVHVADDGPGIAPLLLERIFEAGVSGKGGAGRGLGLAIVQQLVEAAGGKVTVASTPRRGTTFELRLPCA